MKVQSLNNNMPVFKNVILTERALIYINDKVGSENKKLMYKLLGETAGTRPHIKLITRYVSDAFNKAEDSEFLVASVGNRKYTDKFLLSTMDVIEKAVKYVQSLASK